MLLKHNSTMIKLKLSLQFVRKIGSHRLVKLHNNQFNNNYINEYIAKQLTTITIYCN